MCKRGLCKQTAELLSGKDMVNNMKKIDYCRGTYYNFKKGYEKCKNREDCRHYKHYSSLISTEQPYWEMPHVGFCGIKLFRRCKLYKTNE